jgi:hypothetical protein
MGQLREFLEYIFKIFKIWVIVQPWEQALIVRYGKRIRKKEGGIYFKLPYLDSVYVQEVRLRVVEMPIQTLTLKDKNTVTLRGSLGYRITDLEKLYNTLYHPEKTVQNILMANIAEVIYGMDVKDISPKILEEKMTKVLEDTDYGLKFEYCKITDFAIVKTFRLIQDQSWLSEEIDIEKKRE